MIFWWPAYRLSGLLRLITGIVSLFTVYAVYEITPLILNFRTAAQLEEEINHRKKAEAESIIRFLESKRSKELLQVKDDFITMAAHQLRTPLTSLNGYLQIAVNKDFEECSPRHLEIINKAQEQTEKLAQLV